MYIFQDETNIFDKNKLTISGKKVICVAVKTIGQKCGKNCFYNNICTVKCHSAYKCT